MQTFQKLFGLPFGSPLKIMIIWVSLTTACFFRFREKGPGVERRVENILRTLKHDVPNQHITLIINMTLTRSNHLDKILENPVFTALRFSLSTSLEVFFLHTDPTHALCLNLNRYYRHPHNELNFMGTMTSHEKKYRNNVISLWNSFDSAHCTSTSFDFTQIWLIFIGKKHVYFQIEFFTEIEKKKSRKILNYSITN